MDTSYVTSGTTPTGTPWMRETLHVAEVVTRTGETIVTVRDDITNHTIATVSVDGSFSRTHFRGFVQDTDHTVIYSGYAGGEESPLAAALLDTVEAWDAK